VASECSCSSSLILASNCAIRTSSCSSQSAGSSSTRN
jgi:hypothetical protein